MIEPTAIEVLRDLLADVADDNLAEDHALAALAAWTDPDVATAALVEQAVLERLAAAEPHLVRGTFAVVEDPGEVDDDGNQVRWPGSHIEGSTDCPDCTRGTRSVGGVLVCITLPARVGTLDGQPGDTVACGKER